MQPKKKGMVGWYDPVQLGRTALEVVVSSLLGRHADKRVLQALNDSGDIRPRYLYEIGIPSDEFWFDYISDVGDGFDSTYTMAYYATRPRLALKTVDAPLNSYKTEQGRLLVFGGDEVYPVGDWNAYQERLVRQYNAAFPKPSRAEQDGKSDERAVFAIPGNHDWYDSLVAFTTLFCREKYFCGWKCVQNRSYFAIKLPHGWWLFGTDMQLGSSLDEAQMNYFERIVKNHLSPTDRIILCNAEPHWITASMYPKERAVSEKNMGYFEGHILNHQVAVYVAGDRHYYKRHEELSLNGKPISEELTYKRQKIVAGGGGAFLHPTHAEKVDTIGFDHKYQHRKSFPAESTSWWLNLWNLLFILWNRRLGLVTGALYVLTAQAFLTDLGKFGVDRLPQAVASVAAAALTKPIALFWSVLIVLAFFLFTDTHSKIYRFFGGFAHALAHLGAVLLIAWQAAGWVGNGRLLEQFTVVELLETALLIYVGGSIAGPLIMGLYLLISLNIFGRHHNEAFSAIKIADYKNFLRFKIEENGDLVIFPVGVKRAVRKWRRGVRKDHDADLVPDSPTLDNEPFLIEPPIRFTKSEMPAPGFETHVKADMDDADKDGLVTLIPIDRPEDQPNAQRERISIA